jgi:hypothetical protein
MLQIMRTYAKNLSVVIENEVIIIKETRNKSLRDSATKIVPSLRLCTCSLADACTKVPEPLLCLPLLFSNLFLLQKLKRMEDDSTRCPTELP